VSRGCMMCAASGAQASRSLRLRSQRGPHSTQSAAPPLTDWRARAKSGMVLVLRAGRGEFCWPGGGGVGTGDQRNGSYTGRWTTLLW
jgi:hypothetical protein